MQASDSNIGERVRSALTLVETVLRSSGLRSAQFTNCLDERDNARPDIFCPSTAVEARSNLKLCYGDFGSSWTDAVVVCYLAGADDHDGNKLEVSYDAPSDTWSYYYDVSKSEADSARHLTQIADRLALPHTVQLRLAPEVALVYLRRFADYFKNRLEDKEAA